MCHIKAPSENGPQYVPNQSNDERRAFDNFILMCPIHHDVIDSDTESYTVEKLIELKKKHEDTANEDRVSMDIVNQLIINMNVEIKKATVDSKTPAAFFPHSINDFDSCSIKPCLTSDHFDQPGQQREHLQFLLCYKKSLLLQCCMHTERPEVQYHHSPYRAYSF